VIGLGEDETIVASDASAIIQHTTQVVYLDDDDVACVRADRVEVRNIDNVPVSRDTSLIEWDAQAAEKGGFAHFMLKEIFEQPESIRNTIRGRLFPERGTAQMGGLQLTAREIADIQRCVILACGTSLHAGMLGEYFFEELADIPSEVDQAAEFRYRNPIVTPHDLVIAISQSGETADTLAAVREAKDKGALVAGICNVVGSTIARECGRGVYLHAGPEIGVASTKSFSSQVLVLLMMALRFGRGRRVSTDRGIEIVEEILRVPGYVEQVLKYNGMIEDVARRFEGVHSCFFIGRGTLYPVALEGALKLKEISYLHAEGYQAAELKHGPLALLGENVPVVAMAVDVPGKDKMIGNMQECRARRAPVIALATEDDPEIADHADVVIPIPRTDHLTAAIPATVALQLLSYHVANHLGRDIDQPRNLAKSVTVE
jgi:glucosamine--fructose-6-phosphate aminotransferase (isomerizing)